MGYGCWLPDAVLRVALLPGELLGLRNPYAEVAGRCCLLSGGRGGLRHDGDTFGANHLGHAGYGNASGRFMTRWSHRLGSSDVDELGSAQTTPQAIVKANPHPTHHPLLARATIITYFASRMPMHSWLKSLLGPGETSGASKLMPFYHHPNGVIDIDSNVRVLKFMACASQFTCLAPTCIKEPDSLH